MQHTLIFYNSPDDFDARDDPRRRDAFWASFGAYLKAIKDAGIFIGGAGLQPPLEAHRGREPALSESEPAAGIPSAARDLQA